MHIIQEETPASLVDRRRSARIDPGQSTAQWPAHIRNVDNILFLEYLPRGSLQKALCTLQSKQMVVPNRALWHMFHCLIKTCIAMAFPPRENPNLYNAAVPTSERIPQGKRKNRFVHFDIDPCNILVGANEPGSSHPLIPLLKLTDFGLSRTLTQAILNDR
ncbi:hypothetical protein VTH06DRAFT_7378 [Thermothelomyces fergusii]